MKTFPRQGVHPAESKLSAGSPIEDVPLPATVVLPLSQHIGAPAKPVVKARAVVQRGQLIAEPVGFVSVGVHASVSGTVKKILDVMHPNGVSLPAIQIETDPDADEQWCPDLPAPLDLDLDAPAFDGATRKAVVERVRSSGVVGMGGAGFPTHVKLSPPPGVEIDTLLLNGAECEPFLTADHRLMVERAEAVIEGLRILLGLFPGAEGAVGVEANKPDAHEALRRAAEGVPRVRVEMLKAKYPQGGEKQLIWALTGREVPSGKLPMAVGCVVQNVATVAAVRDAVLRGRPLTERVVTVTGDAVAEPRNLRVRLGTAYSHLVEACGGVRGELRKLVSGGPMMGRAQVSLDQPVIKGTSGLLLLSPKAAAPLTEGPCIRCGACLQACPAVLNPTLLADLVSAERWDDLEGAGLMDCIECGSCSYICPAARHLVHRIRLGKSHLRRSAQRAKAAK